MCFSLSFLQLAHSGSQAAGMGAQSCTLTRVLSHTLMLNKFFLEQEQEFSLLLYSEPQFLLHGLAAGLQEALLPCVKRSSV